MSTVHDIVHEVIVERLKQETKWGQQNHEPVKYLSILAEEFGEASKEVVKYTFYEDSHPVERHQRLVNLRKELIQTAAVAVAMIESLDRNELRAK